MLSCLLNGEYVEANSESKRGENYLCPECCQLLLLKKGSIKVPHFSHKQKEGCRHGEGETEWHKKGKLFVAEMAKKKNCTYRFEEKLGNRRTDIKITTKNNNKVAYELQRKDEGKEIYKRTKELNWHVDRVVWILPWKVEEVDEKYRATATYAINALFSENKKPNRSDILFYDSEANEMHRCSKEPWFIEVPERGYYKAAFDESEPWNYDPDDKSVYRHISDAYDKKSKRWCELIIEETFN